MTIRFYSKGEEQWRFLSNFYPATFYYHGVAWPSSEHFYQGMKFSGEVQERVRRLSTPGETKRFARQNLDLVDPNWNERKVWVMRLALLLKFSQNEELTQRLLATGEETLVEDSPRDAYWGCGQDGRGRNVMGRLLMEVRSHLHFMRETDLGEVKQE
jgi:ribA/ribD-fused uncharacterized protein